MSHLLPEGIASLRDAPYPLHHAIKRALMFINFEELRPEDVPPRKIWLDDEALKEWFDEVRRSQREGSDRYGGIEDPQRNAVLDGLIK